MGHRSWQCLTSIILDACWDILSIKWNIRWGEHKPVVSTYIDYYSLAFFLKYFMINLIISYPTWRENVVSTFRIWCYPSQYLEIFSQCKSLYFQSRITGVYNLLTGFACIWDLNINAREVHKQVSVWRVENNTVAFQH